ncbi:SigE family RNA polymerase sigma factor [Actinophytocola gossypii]|uniref:SigE family RNA polymerase sigma factor n=1 Tax=Actinophytocola gossypii TaxID=2812003 RepID=A0ABT2JC68_9PSEU|nr:SigE family RNA polymerase sigma factor [Actinophytocola gossypii]MCT2585361.1 SigE family RNA polymerase sigma factor [Actinophytocola gossypii]
MKRADEAAYRDYVVARMDTMRRLAYLLCRDWHTADDLVSVTISKLYRHFPRVKDDERLDGYVRRILLREWLDERRRPWRRETPTDVLPDLGSPVEYGVLDRAQLLDLLDGMPPRRRAAVVLRLYCDLSVEETAEILGCTTGTVKSQTARGLYTLRARAAEVTD